MKTAYQTGPGMYAADTSGHARYLPDDTMRVYCARIEAYDLELRDKGSINTQFQVLFAQADDNPEVARALLKLADTINCNRGMLERMIKE